MCRVQEAGEADGAVGAVDILLRRLSAELRLPSRPWGGGVTTRHDAMHARVMRLKLRPRRPIPDSVFFANSVCCTFRAEIAQFNQESEFPRRQKRARFGSGGDSEMSAGRRLRPAPEERPVRLAHV